MLCCLRKYNVVVKYNHKLVQSATTDEDNMNNSLQFIEDQHVIIINDDDDDDELGVETVNMSTSKPKKRKRKMNETIAVIKSEQEEVDTASFSKRNTIISTSREKKGRGRSNNKSSDKLDVLPSEQMLAVIESEQEDLDTASFSKSNTIISTSREKKGRERSNNKSSDKLDVPPSEQMLAVIKSEQEDLDIASFSKSNTSVSTSREKKGKGRANNKSGDNLDVSRSEQMLAVTKSEQEDLNSYSSYNEKKAYRDGVLQLTESIVIDDSDDRDETANMSTPKKEHRKRRQVTYFGNHDVAHPREILAETQSEQENPHPASCSKMEITEVINSSLQLIVKNEEHSITRDISTQTSPEDLKYDILLVCQTPHSEEKTLAVEELQLNTPQLSIKEIKSSDDELNSDMIPASPSSHSEQQMQAVEKQELNTPQGSNSNRESSPEDLDFELQLSSASSDSDQESLAGEKRRNSPRCSSRNRTTSLEHLNSERVPVSPPHHSEQHMLAVEKQNKQKKTCRRSSRNRKPHADQQELNILRRSNRNRKQVEFDFSSYVITYSPRAAKLLNTPYKL